MAMAKNGLLRYFELSEFDSPDYPGSGRLMNPITLKKFDQARSFAGIPFVIESGYRTVERNQKVGGHKNSAHLRGYAADIRYKSEADAVRIIAALTTAGFSRIGKNRTTIHADDDPRLPQPAYWDYGQ